MRLAYEWREHSLKEGFKFVPGEPEVGESLSSVESVLQHIQSILDSELAMILGLHESFNAISEWFSARKKVTYFLEEVLTNRYFIGLLLDEHYPSIPDKIFELAFLYSLKNNRAEVIAVMAEKFGCSGPSSRVPRYALVRSFQEKYLAKDYDFCKVLLGIDNPFLLAFVTRSDAAGQEFFTS